uniref:Uncharacterized protein n=1 Tax=Leersia perrieri TaxID=77586 RepID=A0A0D9VTQ3_9ORYZ
MRSAVSRTTPARPTSLPGLRASRAVAGRPTFGRGVAATTTTFRLRARCGGGTEPVVARKEDNEPGKEEEEAVAEELEVLEEEAMGGGDEGRRPTDYDRRAHIFEESSRVFSALKHRHDHDHDEAGAAGETKQRHADSGR